MTYKPNKLGPTELACDLWPEFIGMWVHTALQIATYDGYDTFHPG